VVSLVAAILGRPRILPVAIAALPLTVIAGRWVEVDAVRSLSFGLALAWSVSATLFAGRWMSRVAVGAVAVVFAAPLWWYGVAVLPVAVAYASIAALVLAAVMVTRSQLIRATQTVAAVFEHAPVGIMEQSWAETLEEIEALRRAGITDMEAYLRSNPSEAGRLFATARLVSANEYAARVFPPPGPDGRHSPELINEAMFEDTVALMVDLFEGRFDRTVVWPMPDGQGVLRWHQITGFRHPSGDGEFIFVSADITDVKRAEEALEQLVVSKDRFVAAISHELRTPLAAVVGFTSELLQDWDAISDGERREFLSIANDQAMEATNIISDLLVAARADIGGVTVTHGPVEVPREVGRALAGNGWDVPVICPDVLPVACADKGRLRQVLRNLLTNAVRYGGASERIVMSAGQESVSVEVRDDGPELSQAQLDALFEPYARAHQSAGITESVGLGLTVARHLAVLMNGTLVAFRDGEETVFRVTLPMMGHCPGTGDKQVSAKSASPV
jgi:signal transduction histidine kinase